MKGHASNNFDFVRLIAASLVIVGHAYPLNALASPGFFQVSIETYAVKIFFVLSGYLVTKSWIEDPHIPRFLARRALRIFPALIGVTILSAFALGPIATRLSLIEYFRNPSLWTYFQNVALYIHYYLPGVFETNLYPGAVNGSLWSLSAEFFMYIIVPVLGGIFAGRNFRAGYFIATGLIVLANMYFLQIASQPLPRVVFYATDMMAWLAMAPYFMVGGCLFAFRDVIKPDLAIALALVLAGLWLTTSGLPAVETLLLGVTSYAVISFGLASSPLISRAGRYGDISYGLYLYGYPVQQLVSWQLRDRVSVAAQIIISLIGAGACAFASWRLIEEPALRFKPRRARGRICVESEGRSDWRRPAGQGARPLKAQIEPGILFRSAARSGRWRSLNLLARWVTAKPPRA
jgi:peptidoglycan/LPS O-acetylase OafA/YrhL